MSLGIKKLSKGKPFTRKILVYGPAGEGKTTFAASIRDAGFNPLVVDMDGGSSTLDGTDIAATVKRRFKDLEQVVWAFVRKEKEVADFNALIVDGLSAAVRLELQAITELAAKATEGSKKERDKDVAQLADHGLKNNRLLRAIWQLRDLEDVPVIATAWSKMSYPEIPDANGKMVENKDAAPREIAPDFSDSLKEVVAGTFHDVFYMSFNKEKNRRELYTSNFRAVKAKTRIPEYAALLTTKVGDATYPVLVNPTMTDIVNAYKKAMGQGQ